MDAKRRKIVENLSKQKIADSEKKLEEIESENTYKGYPLWRKNKYQEQA